MEFTYADIAGMIDHSLLNPMLNDTDLEAGCRLAAEYEVASVCILPHWLRRCAQMLEGTDVHASTTVGFPHGGNTTAVKSTEAERALAELEPTRELDLSLEPAPHEGVLAAQLALDVGLGIDSAQHAFKRAKACAGVDKIGGIHGLRHAYATHQLAAGLPVHMLQRLLGHRSIHSTMRYVHWVPSYRDAGVRHRDLVGTLGSGR